MKTGLVLFVDQQDRQALIEFTSTQSNLISRLSMLPPQVLAHAKAYATYLPLHGGPIYQLENIIKPYPANPQYFSQTLDSRNFQFAKRVYGKLRPETSMVAKEDRLIFTLGFRAENGFVLPHAEYFAPYEILDTVHG